MVQPYIDDKQHLKIRDVDFDLKTKSILLHSAKWMLDDKIKEKLQQAVDVDLGPMLLETQKAIEEQLNTEITKGVWLSGKINEMQIQNLLLTSGSLVIDLRLSGLLKLKIE